MTEGADRFCNSGSGGTRDPLEELPLVPESVAVQLAGAMARRSGSCLLSLSPEGHAS